MTDAEVIDSMLDRLSGGKGATPRPWALEPEGAWIYAPECSDPGDCVCDMPSEGDFSRARWIANAALIVKAVNAYDDMLAALKKMASWLDAQAERDEQRAEDRRFPSLAEACAADARNFRAMSKDLKASITKAEGAAP